EHRLLLREDNADTRLTPIGRRLELIDDERWSFHERKQDAIERELGRLEGFRVTTAAAAAADPGWRRRGLRGAPVHPAPPARGRAAPGPGGGPAGGPGGRGGPRGGPRGPRASPRTGGPRGGGAPATAATSSVRKARSSARGSTSTRGSRPISITARSRGSRTK